MALVERRCYMNKKGFTLTELVATIVLLGMISSISFISINKTVEINKDNTCKTLVNNIKAAASEYISDKRYDNYFIDNQINDYKLQITVDDLLKNEYLSNVVVNPYNSDEVIDGKDILVDIYFSDDNYNITNINILSPTVLVKCQD